MIIAKIKIKLNSQNKNTPDNNNTYNIKELRSNNNVLTEISENICTNFIAKHKNNTNININENGISSVMASWGNSKHTSTQVTIVNHLTLTMVKHDSENRYNQLLTNLNYNLFKYGRKIIIP